MKLFIGMVVVFTLILFGCNGLIPAEPQAPPTSPQQNEITYTYYSSPAFFVYYPRGWQINNQEQGLVIFTAPKETADDLLLEEFIVEVWAGNETTPEDFMNYEKQFIVPEDTITKNQKIRFKDRDAQVIEIEGKPNGNRTKTMFYKTVFFRNGQGIYRLNYAIEKSKLAKYQPIMESILDKFKIGSYY